jgi:DNA helicase-2/ATP-dependent DNA helicase PcrA
VEKIKFNDIKMMLNEAQSGAVNSIDGPLMVIAGPGTGKTQLLKCQSW